MLPFLSITILITFHICLSQSQTDPLTSFTQSPNTFLPNSQSSLLPGYDSNNNRIWLLGGDRNNNGANRDEVWYYDIDTNQFQDVRSITADLDELFSQSSTYIGNSIYFVNDDKLQRFDIGTTDGTFYNLGNTLTTNLNILSPCVTKSKDDKYIFIVGGEDTIDGHDGTILFQIYDIQATQFHSGTPLIRKRRFLSCNVSPDGNNLYVFGGVYESGTNTFVARTSIEKLDISNMNTIISGNGLWIVTSMTMLSNEWYSRTVVDYINNLIYIIGGRADNSQDSPDDRIQILNATSDTLYSSSRTLNTGRAAPTVINVAQKIYVFGGYTVNNGILSTFEICSVLDVSPTSMPTRTPTMNPTIAPISPTNIPSKTPTTNPSKYPSKYPTNTPSKHPTNIPTNYPSKLPTIPPTFMPSIIPTISPTKLPSISLSNVPTETYKDGSVIVQSTHDSGNTNKKGSIPHENGTQNSYFVVTGIALVLVILCIILICCGFCIYWRKTKSIIQASQKANDTNGKVEMIRKVNSVSSAPGSSDMIQYGDNYNESMVIMNTPGIINGENNINANTEETQSSEEEVDELYGVNNNTVTVGHKETDGELAADYDENQLIEMELPPVILPVTLTTVGSNNNDSQDSIDVEETDR